MGSQHVLAQLFALAHSRWVCSLGACKQLADVLVAGGGKEQACVTDIDNEAKALADSGHGRRMV